MSERYQVRGRIGRGGMSAVYRAWDSVVGREVAIKRLLPVEETALNEAASSALTREAAALASFQHPNVVTIFAFESDEEGPFVVMELVEGEILSAIIERKTLTWEEFRDVAVQCLEALVAAGERNLLHRDIKPANLMLKVSPSGRYQVKLLDFGLAKFSQSPSLQTVDQRGSFLGSIDYIAPEQLELLPLDSRTDLYSLGCLFYYMLTGRPPFSGETPAETSQNHLRHRCEPVAEKRPDLPALVADWVMRLVSRYPEDRPADAREATRQYQDALKGIPYVPPPAIPDVEEFDPFADDFEPVPVVPKPVPPDPELCRSREAVRSLKTPSGPVPAVRKITGPIAGEGSSRPLNLPPVARRRPPGPSAAVSPWRSPAGSVGPGSPPRWRPPWGVFVAAAALLLAGLAAGVLIADREPRPVSLDPPREVRRPDTDLPFLYYPASLSLSDGRPDPPALPVEEGLFARFHAGKGILKRDYQSFPEEGDPVAAWVNLVAPAPERSLLRDLGDDLGEHLPRFLFQGPDQVPGLAGRRPGLTTTNRTSLTMMKHPGVLPRGFTLVAVLRIQGRGDRLFRIQPPVGDGRFVSMVGGRDGKVAAVYRDNPELEDRRVAVPWEKGSAGILSYLWDPQQKRQRLLVRIPGLADATASGPIEFTGAAFGTVALGKRGFSDVREVETGNVFFEFVVYERVLEPTELESLMREFSRRYLSSR